jgi:demethylmenaquinone methyltransferase/2-methoxy-6-polyprenyl-1,4-benzoquinol methylase
MGPGLAWPGWRAKGPRAKDTARTGPAATFGFRDVDPTEKAGLVRGVFDRVARRYDLMNDLMSGGVHRLWKDAVAARLNPQPGETIIDVAGGTGDMARRFARMARRAQLRRGGADARIFVIDYNAEMIAAGVAKGTEPEIAWAVGDAQALPLPDASAEAYVIAFGIRNVTDIPAALREARRVLKPGGRFLCLEFSRPVTEMLQKAYAAYSFKVIPEIGARVGGDRAAYQYLVESIQRFPDQKTFAAMIAGAGFGQVGYTNYTGGVAALHTGRAV